MVKRAKAFVGDSDSIYGSVQVEEIEVICDTCRTDLGTGDDICFEIGSEIYCEECFEKYAIEVLRAKKITAGEIAVRKEM